MQQGFSKSLGIALKRFIQKSTSTPFSSLLSGMGVTLLLQSSTATSLLAVSIAQQKIIGFSTALAIILGADIGTTLVVQVLTFDLSWLYGLLLVAGIALYITAKDKSPRQFYSQILIGIGIMLLSLGMIKTIAAPADDMPWLVNVVTYISADHLFLFICAAFFTWLIHSSVAAVLLTATFVATGLLDLQSALYIVLGANLGGSFIAFVASLGEGALARQITFGNVIMRAAGTALCFMAVPYVALYISDLGLFSDERNLVMFHSGFNVLLCALFLPFLSRVEKVSRFIFRDEHKPGESHVPKYLDYEDLSNPSLALSHATRETVRMAEMAEVMLEKTIKAFEGQDYAIIGSIKKTDHDIDHLNEAVKVYVTKLYERELDRYSMRRSTEILTFATNIENIGDVIDKSLMNLAKKRLGQHMEFSKEGYDEIKAFHDLVLDNLKLAQAVFMTQDEDLAHKLIENKRAVTEAAKKTLRKHFDRLADGIKESYASSGVHMDVIRDLQRINSYATRIAFIFLEKDPEPEDPSEQIPVDK